MKRLKIGFASIIAVLAVTLTIAAQAGAFETKKVVLPNCYIPTSLAYGTDCASAGSISVGDLCSATNVVNAPNKLVFGALSDAPADKITPAQIETACAGDRVVCCVFIEEIETNCASALEQELDGVTAKFRITSVDCKF